MSSELVGKLLVALSKNRLDTALELKGLSIDHLDLAFFRVNDQDMVLLFVL